MLQAHKAIANLLKRGSVELADAPQPMHGDWWEKLTDDERRAYTQQHPKTSKKNMHRGDTPGQPQDPSKQGKQAPAPAAPTAQPASSSPGQQLRPAHPDRNEWPEHIKALKLPPAWTGVRINHDPHADLLAIGKDAKNRDQYVYSPRFAASQAALKFDRINELNDKFDEVKDQNKRSQQSKDPVVNDHGDCMAAVMHMGIRPGSDDDTGAEKKAYGASTLEGRHVVVKDGQVRLQFVGKKGISLDLPVEDPELAEMFKNRAKKAGETGKLFGNVTDKSLLNYAHSLDGGGYKTKDFRTLKGTRTAYALVENFQVPKNEREYKKAVHAVAVHVSKHLGNTPAVALSAYISPVVFGKWRAAISGGFDKKPAPGEEVESPAEEKAPAQ